MLKHFKFLSSTLLLICTIVVASFNSNVEAAHVEVKMWGGFRDKVIIGGDAIVIARAVPGVHVVLPALHIGPPPPHHHIHPPRHHRPPRHRPVIAPPPPRRGKHHDFKKPPRPPVHREDKFRKPIPRGKFKRPHKPPVPKRQSIRKPLPPRNSVVHKPVPRPMPKQRPSVKPAPQPKKRPEIYQPIPQQRPVYRKPAGGMSRGGFGRRSR